jgi:hypothetical protein
MGKKKEYEVANPTGNIVPEQPSVGSPRIGGMLRISLARVRLGGSKPLAMTDNRRNWRGS